MVPRALRHDDVDAHLNAIGADVVDSAWTVHKALGPGLLERVYTICLISELHRRGRRVEAEVPVDVSFGDARIERAFRLDLLVDSAVIVEVKAVQALEPVHYAQVDTYLKLTGQRLGYLINFNVVRIHDGLSRRVRTRQPTDASAASARSAPLRLRDDPPR